MDDIITDCVERTCNRDELFTESLVMRKVYGVRDVKGWLFSADEYNDVKDNSISWKQ